MSQELVVITGASSGIGRAIARAFVVEGNPLLLISRRIELLYLVVAELHLKLGLASGAAYESVFKVPSPTGNASMAATWGAPARWTAS